MDEIPGSADLGETVQRRSRHSFRRADDIHRQPTGHASPTRDTTATITMWISSNTDIGDVIAGDPSRTLQSGI